MVAGPRNHLYRTGHPLIEARPFLFTFVHTDLDHVGDFAYDLDLKAGFCRSNDYTFEEAAQDLDRFIPNLRIIQGVLEPLDFPSVDLRQIWVKSDGWRRRRSYLIPGHLGNVGLN